MSKIVLVLAALLMLHVEADAKTTKKVHKKATHKHVGSSKPTYYYNNSDGTISQGKPDERRPSAYKGDRVPENDGAKKNQQRNLNYNTGQALPASNGK